MVFVLTDGILRRVWKIRIFSRSYWSHMENSI